MSYPRTGEVHHSRWGSPPLPLQPVELNQRVSASTSPSVKRVAHDVNLLGERGESNIWAEHRRDDRKRGREEGSPTPTLTGLTVANTTVRGGCQRSTQAAMEGGCGVNRCTFVVEPTQARTISVEYQRPITPSIPASRARGESVPLPIPSFITSEREYALYQRLPSIRSHSCTPPPRDDGVCELGDSQQRSTPLPLGAVAGVSREASKSALFAHARRTALACGLLTPPLLHTPG